MKKAIYFMDAEKWADLETEECRQELAKANKFIITVVCGYWVIIIEDENLYTNDNEFGISAAKSCPWYMIFGCA